ncbi:cholinephosphotransferase 1 isoform X4 [Toxorhynchites rutilus septentrionalis]|uniref:cholinephosphotransferase 1 isoform X4 n=1 Tax=Toxorhynchites rutilus septentrionalis TaxID=329112 RepID=UPI0024794C90|nr:cholinephosphotransferase 1 isoform X4 [Toxorhynchites rutilus septentrionalis]
MKFYKQKLLQPAQLKKLGDHKYSCSNVSMLDPFLQPWWCWLVGKVPLWLAPNLITIVGLIINIVTTLILIYFSPNGREEPPRWACALCALGLFIYQSLDAIDGKQARRTNSSTPLGELFDHGCDSISTVFVALSACVSVQLGYYPRWMFFQCFCAMTLFYCAHWQTYVSGTLRFGKIDVTEAQCTIIGIHLISAVFGPSIWMTKMPVIGSTWNYTVCAIFSLGYLQVFITFCRAFREGGVGKNGSTVALPIVGGVDIKIVPLYFAVFVYGLLAYENASVIFTGGVGKNGSTVAGTSVLSPIIPFLFVVVPAYVISQKSPDRIYENYPALYIMAFGMITAKVTNRLVVAHMTRSEMEYLDWGLIGPLCLFLNQYFNCFLPEYYVLVFAMLWCCVDLIRYCGQVCLEICTYLKIELFRIPYPPKPQMTSQGTNPPHHHESKNGMHIIQQQQQHHQNQQSQQQQHHQANRKPQGRTGSRKHNAHQ